MVGPLPQQSRVHLDRGYDSTKPRDLLKMLATTATSLARGYPPDSGREALGGRADTFVDERLRQAPAVHGQTRHGRPILPRVGRGTERASPPNQAGTHLLPLAAPTHHPPTQVNIICRWLLSAIRLLPDRGSLRATMPGTYRQLPIEP